eukprot:12539740-Alexandrium_andersonii.AAC.1
MASGQRGTPQVRATPAALRARPTNKEDVILHRLLETVSHRAARRNHERRASRPSRRNPRG